MQVQAEHIHGHSSMGPMHDQVGRQLSTAIDNENQTIQRFSTAVQADINGVCNAGAEADVDESLQKIHAGTKTFSKRARPPQLRARKDEPESLHSRHSTTSTPTHKKRKRIADKTYRAPTLSSDSNAEYIPIQAASSKKRRKIADPTYRNFELGSSTSSDENVVARKKGGQKRKVEGREGANLSVIEEDARCMEGDAARQDLVDGCVGSAVEGGGEGAPSENEMDMNIDADEGEEREGEGDAVGVKVWWNSSVM